MKKLTKTFLGLTLMAAVAVSGGVASAATIIDDFSGGVTAANHPNLADGGSDAFSTWYDITNDTFGGGAASGGGMLITDGGFTNGVYAIYQAVVPANGIYTVSADILVNDTATSDISDYQIGAVVNGVHRGANPSDLAIITGVGHYTGLTADVLDVTVTQNVETATFSASAGDNVLVAFGTSIDTLDFDSNSGFWNSATVLVDNIMLNAIPEPTSALLVVMGAMAFVARRK